MGGVFQGLWEGALPSGFPQTGRFHSLVFSRELLRSFVSEGAVRTMLIVIVAVLLDECACLEQRGEDLAIEQFVTEAAVERLAIGILPGAARLDERRFDVPGGEPGAYGACNELRSVVGADERGRAVSGNQVLENLDDPLAGDVVRGFDVQALPREVVDDGQDLEHSSILELIENEVVAPDVVLSLGTKLHNAILALPKATSLLRTTDDFQPFFTADPAYALAVHLPRAATQFMGQPAIAVPRMLSGQFDHPGPQAPVSIAYWPYLVALR